MRRLCQLNFALLLGAFLCAASDVVWAESGVLVVHVEDVHGHPISGVQITTKGDGGSPITDDKGTARITLAKDTKEKSWVSLQIVKSPPHRDFEMVSPWDHRAVVPSFENESDNFVEVVVMQRGDLDALKSSTVLAALTAQINKANAPVAQKSYIVSLGDTLTTSDSLAVNQDGSHSVKENGERAAEQQTKAALAVVASNFGIAPDEVDKAIRAWGARTTDPYEAGLAALYERNYPKASAQLADSLRVREGKLAGDQEAVAGTAFFLGLSLYQEGKYRESATVFQRCLQFRPDDGTVLNDLAQSLFEAGDYADAEPLSRRAVAIKEKTLGPDDPSVAASINNLASLLRAEGHYADAEVLYRRALAIREKALGPDSPDVAGSLSNLASLLEATGYYEEAELLFGRALGIWEKASGPDSPDVAKCLNNLAELLLAEGKYAGADPLYRRALAIQEKTLGPDHPEVATTLDNLGSLLRAKGDYAGAEPLQHRALEIYEKRLGPNHPEVAIALNNLALLLCAEGDCAGAVPLLRRALAIDEKVLGPDHPTTKRHRSNLQAIIGEESAKKTEK
jgi:tetratricopeptide (TPR) repeat protein